MRGIGTLCSFRCAGASTKPSQIAARRTQGVLKAVIVKAIRKMAIKVHIRRET
jgi:hypothetical protein